MNILTDKDAFIVSNMFFDTDEAGFGLSSGWKVHDTFKASGLEVMGLFAFSHDDEDQCIEFTLNKELVHPKAVTPSIGELKKLFDEMMSKIPAHKLNY